MSVLDTLLAWDKALNAHGIAAKFEYKVFNEGDFEEERGEYLCVCLDDHHWAFSDIGDDHTAAEFVSRVTEKVFGPWAYYKSSAPAENDAIIWTLMKPDEPEDSPVASGLTRIEALLSALQSLPVKEEGS